MLAKRISAASMSSADGPTDLYQTGGFIARQELTTPPTTHSITNQRPSAIPRPSLQQSRTAGDPPNGAVHPAYLPRSRTLSQPYAFDSPNPTDSSAFSSGPSRSASPALNGKTTRIPVSRGRAGSTSSHTQGSMQGSVGRTEQELYPVEEGQRSYTSRSTVRLPNHKTSDIFSESAPFGTDSHMSSRPEFDHEFFDAHRYSSESEERPFEHWYRGDMSRNGGVGELRVGKRDEMLDIASYGHTIRKPSHGTSHGKTSRSRSNSRGRDFSASRHGTRPRAESIGATVRESIYIDDDEHANDSTMVLDEQPPTDVEADFDNYEEADAYPYEQDVLPHPNGTISTPSLSLNTSQTSATAARSHRTTPSNISRIPTPTSYRQISPPPRTPTPSKAVRGATENGATSSASSTPRAQRMPRSQSQPQTQTQAQRSPPSAKRKAKSPAASSSGSAAAKKSKPPSSMRRMTPRKEENRRSIGQYPATDGDDVVDAIPVWTQPVPPSGNWDDVVLPVVARKKGLDGHYATVDGSPRPKQTRETEYEPAPGTFGFDYSKVRRRPPPGDGEEQIPLDEFGQKTDAVNQLIDEQPKPQAPLFIKSPEPEPDRARSRASPPPSPPPFAHYATALANGEVQAIQPPVQKLEVDDDKGAGCCKCVIM